MKLQVLLFQGEKRWTAVGLEHCVFGSGLSIEDALNAFFVDLAQQLILDQAAGYEPLSETPPADPEFWERYQKSSLRLLFDIPLPEPAQGWTPEIRVAA